jgi:hypothetical protein
MCTISGKEAAWRLGARGRKKAAENRKKLRVEVWHGEQEMPVARARVYRTGKKVILPLLPLELWAPYKKRWVWAGAVIFASATCSLQFAKASAATLSQQQKNNSADLQRGRVNIISRFMYTVES